MRGKGEGSIYRRSSDGRWVGHVKLGRLTVPHVQMLRSPRSAPRVERSAERYRAAGDSIANQA